MGITTFSGPIKAGPTKDTTGTTVGTDIQNTGSVLMAQSARVDVVGATATTTVATLPPGAQVTNVSLNVFEAVNASATATMTIGTATGDGTFLASTVVTSITNVRSSAMGTASINVGTGGAQIFATFFPTSPANVGVLGDAIATVEYMQPVSAGGFYTI